MDPILDEGGLKVFTDWLLERGFEPMTPLNTDRPWNMEHQGKISAVKVYWFNSTYRGLKLEVHVDWETTRTRIRPAAIRARQHYVELTWKGATAAVIRALELQQEIDASAQPRVPGVPDGMEQPPGLSEAGARAWRTLVGFFKKSGLTHTGGGTAFYSPEEWSNRKESVGDVAAVLVVTYDGGEHRAAFEPEHRDDVRLSEAMTAALEKEGFYFEPWYSWASGVYAL
jgi:hypothetical protein